MSEDIPHPRATFDLVGGEAQEAAVVSALARGRMHHAWLIAGPEGVGKATLAYRIARRLLGARPKTDLGVLGSAPEDPVCRQIAARAHPDLVVVQRDPEDGKARKGIPVEEARALPEFFAKSPASAPFRVAIVDTADDLNRFGANAVLKILEEPPERGVIVILTTAPGGLLATLRSRCRRLKFAPPPAEVARRWLMERVQIGPEAADRLLALASGAPGRAWTLSGQAALDVDRATGDILSRLPAVDASAMLKLSESFRGPAGAIRFELLFERLAARIQVIAAERALAERHGDAGQDRWAQAWELVSRLPGEVEAVNLDRVDAFYSVLSRLRAIA